MRTNELRAKGEELSANLVTKLAVFLITLSGLILEVGLTRIYSASIWYHFAFVAISVALLGWGLGGFTVHLLKTGVRGKSKGGRESGAGKVEIRGQRSEVSEALLSPAPRAEEKKTDVSSVSPSPNPLPEAEGESRATLSINAAALVTLLYAGTIPLCLWLLVRYPFDMDRLPLYFLAPLLSFFLAGMALSIVFDIHRAIAGTLYFYDLIGAALGAVLVTVLLHLLGGEAALLVATIAPAIAALLMSLGKEYPLPIAGGSVPLSPASRAQENKNNVSDPGVARSALTPGYPMSRLQRDDGPASRAQENKKEGTTGVTARPSPNPLAEGEGESNAPSLTVRFLPRIVQVAAALGVVLAIVAVVATVKYGAFRVKPGTTKAMRNQMDAAPGSHIVQTGWNAYSRIDCVEGLPNSFARLYIDSDAWTGIRGWDGNLDSVQDMKWSYRALPFRLTPNAETLIIGPGGGPDVVAALASGSKKVTAVEMNPLMLKFVRSYGARAGSLYDRPDVEAILSEGRNFISRTDRKFDIILLGFVDSWASVASGGLSLSENKLYTTEAMRAYYDHLSDNGILVVLRWEMDIPRLTSNAVATLGANEAKQRVVVLMEKQANPNDYSQMLFMLRKQPFTTDQMAEMRTKWTQANPIIRPDGTAPPGLKEVLAGSKTMQQYDAESTRFVGAVWDDSPFYFAIEKPWRMPGAIAERMMKWLLGPSLGMLALFAVFGKRRVTTTGKQSTLPYVGSLVYFAALGFGFIAV